MGLGNEAGKFELLHFAFRSGEGFRIGAELDKVLENLISKDLEDSLEGGKDRRDTQQFTGSMPQFKCLVGMGKAVVRDEACNMGEFGLLAAEKLLSCGNVVEKIANGDDG